MPFLIRKDALGYRLAPYMDYNGQIFTLESGEKVGKYQGWIAEPENLLAMATDKAMKTPEELTIPELDGSQLTNFLAKMGRCLDHEWRIRQVMREPFTKIKATHVLPMIELHLQVCGAKKKDPANVPINLGWIEEAIGIFAIDKPQIAMLPEFEGGEIALYQDRMGKQQVVLKHGDWYAYPKGQREDAPMCTLWLMQFMDRTEVTGEESVEALLGKDRFVTPEGILVNRGGHLTISIDDFFPQEQK